MHSAGFTERLHSSGTLYFFPAFLPLIEIVPWLMTLIGVVVAAAGFSFPDFIRKYRILLFVLVVFLGVVGAVCVKNIQVHKKALSPDVPHLIEPPVFPEAIIYQTPPKLMAANLSGFQKLWQVKINRRILSTPVFYGDVLVYGSFDGSLEAISLQDGAHVWSLPLETYTSSLSKDGQGNIYAGEGLHDTEFSNLTSFNTKTKAVNWQRKFAGHIEGLPVVDEQKNKIWVSAGPGGLWALNKENADILLHLPFGHIDSEPLLYNDRVYIQAQSDPNVNLTTLFAVNEADGEIIWQLPQVGQPWGSPLLHDDKSFILTTTGLGQIGVEKNTDKGWAYAVTMDGEIKWKRELPDMAIQPSIYIPSENMYINTLKSGEIIALDAANGNVKWQVKVGDKFFSTATHIEDMPIPMIAATAVDGGFVILDARSGSEITRQVVGKNSSSSPLVVGDVVYVSTAYGISAFGGLHSLAVK